MLSMRQQHDRIVFVTGSPGGVNLSAPSVAVEAVSYTHLDVYKRQSRFRATSFLTRWARGFGFAGCWLVGVWFRAVPPSSTLHGSFTPCASCSGSRKRVFSRA